MGKLTAQLNRLIKTIEEVPTLPIISRKVMELARDEDASFKDIAGVIEKDQALAAKIIKVANSAFYGFLGRVNSLEHALLILGRKEINGILLAFSVQSFFSGNRSDSFDRSRFWKHSIICSQVAKFLGRRFNIRDDDTLFLTGLIHDIGKVVIDQYLPDGFVEIIGFVASRHTTFSKAEKEILGTTHYQVAAKLLKQWRFPNNVILDILYHHAPWRAKYDPIGPGVIYLADLFTKAAGYGCHPEEEPIDLDRFAHSPEIAFFNRCGLDVDAQTLNNLFRQLEVLISREAENMLRLFEN